MHKNKWGQTICGGLQVVYSREDTLQTHQRSRNLFRQSKVVNLVKRTSLVATFGLLCVVSVFGSSRPTGADAQTQYNCAEPETHYGVSDEALIAPATYNYVSLISKANTGSSHTWSAACVLETASHDDVLSNYAQIVRMKLLGFRANRAMQAIRGQQVAQSARKRLARRYFMTTRRNVVLQTATHLNDNGVSNVAVGEGNPFPYGQCTWWADQRYYQLHGVFVPWRINANAWQWTTRAYQFGWDVSPVPQAGEIMVLQPGTQGAWGMGHVGVVEHVFPGGRFTASSMNWGADRGGVTYAQFHTGPGVAFISQ
jgi:surface antigen